MGYWRSDVGAIVCPYCRLGADSVNFLRHAQKSYIAKYCAKFADFMAGETEDECVIDMDAVADAAGSDLPKPEFYYAERSQQNRFTCNACSSLNDVLGKFAYCSACGTRNDLQELTEKVLPYIRKRINDEKQFESSAKDAVSAFDSLVGSYVRQLVEQVPLTKSRRNRLTGRRFHNLKTAASDLKEIFDIDILRDMHPDDVAFAVKMFHRRHVYEHTGGEADQQYIEDSGDTSVQPKQALRESVESANRIVGLVQKMARNLHDGFHELIPVDEIRTKEKEQR